MAEDQQQPPPINGLEIKNSTENAQITNTSSFPFSYPSRRCKWWLQVALYAFLVVAGQSASTLLGRLYFTYGGESKWIASLVQVVGFPVLFPLRFFKTGGITNSNRSFPTVLALFYLVMGISAAADCMLFSVGLQYLPVTTFSLICASQLGFMALITSFLNGQKFTPYIVNSIVLLTISSVLLVFQPDSGDSKKSSRKNYAIGFVCTLAGCAGAALQLSLTQLAFQKLIKRESLRAIVDMAAYQCLVASVVLVVGLLTSGDWRRVRGEIKGYGLGKVSYVMNLFWTSVCWQVYAVGVIGLVFKVSSLFSSLIMTLGLPAPPVMAVIFLSDRLTGLKAIALVLAMWGSASYIYQHYLDDLEMEEKQMLSDEEVSEVALVDQRA